MPKKQRPKSKPKTAKKPAKRATIKRGGELSLEELDEVSGGVDLSTAAGTSNLGKSGYLAPYVPGSKAILAPYVPLLATAKNVK